MYPWQPPPPFQLSYPDKSGCTQVLFIENEMKEPEVFSNSANDATFPIIYSSTSTKTDVLTLLRSKFTSIDRIALAFNSNLGTIKQFLDNQPFFSDESTENVTFIIDVIKEFQVKNIDYLACQTLNYPIWTNYYDTLTSATGVVVGASNDQTGNLKYGGDWVLENTAQDIEAIYFTESIEYYQYVLDTTYVTFTTFPSGKGPYLITGLGSNLYTLNGTGGFAKINLDGSISTLTFSTGFNNPTELYSYGSYLYVVNYNDGKIIQIKSDGTFNNSNFTPSKSGYVGPASITSDGTNFIVSYFGTGAANTGIISKYDMTGVLVTANFITGLTQPFGMRIDNGILYVCINVGGANGTAFINKYNVTTGALITSNWATGLSGPGAINIYGPHMYVSNYPTKAVTQILISTGATVSTTFVSGFSELSSATILGDSMYIANDTGLAVYRADMPPFTNNVICFKEGSKILTDKGYRPIEQLRKGDKVKTLLHGFVPIDMIGKRDIFHVASKDRIKDQLYVCNNDVYPEVFEPLVITGCHCILIDEFFSEQQREDVIVFSSRIFITDNQYRLPACLDERTKVYDKPGTYTIYHFALEHEDYYMNYGIYANGLLVETCSKRFMKELSNMEIL